MAVCFHCLSDSVVWDNDYNFEDFCMEGEGTVHSLHCNNCGADILYMIKDEEPITKENAHDKYCKGCKYYLSPNNHVLCNKEGETCRRLTLSMFTEVKDFYEPRK